MAGPESDDFGDSDEDALIFAATQVEALNPQQHFQPSPRAVKRRRLSPPTERRLLASEHSRDSTDENGRNSGPAAAAGDSAKKPKYRTFNPANNRTLDQVILQQDQPFAQSQPWQIRGPIWNIRKEAAARPESSKRSHLGPSEDALPSEPSGEDDNDVEPQDDTSKPDQELALAVPGKGQHTATDYANELANLPSDMFSSSSGSPQDEVTFLHSNQAIGRQRAVAPQNGLVQTTLFNHNAASAAQPPANKRQRWPLADATEPPTHHELNAEACNTWVYPTNLGRVRDYQFNIVSRGLFHNLLVALPTGLGKTFIAATIMLNWFRWTKNAKLIFVAPTKPLVTQQVEACFNIVGIPRHETTMLTGEVSAGLRADEWENKRVFFMTPQTLLNDLSKGVADPKSIVLLVVDEAHRATGSYAYVKVVEFISRYNKSFRVLALTATPGADVEAVQKVVDGLNISRIEIRTEKSLDIREYVHQKQVEKAVFRVSDEMELLMDLYSKALQPALDVITGMNAYWQKDPVALTPFGCNQAMRQWMTSDAGRHAHQGVKGKVCGIFGILASLAHGMELLKYHGIAPFFHSLTNFRKETETTSKSKYRKEINTSEPFEQMIRHLTRWTADPTFIGHPKLERLQEVILNHLMDAGEGTGEGTSTTPATSSTRIMVFAHFRDSAEEICKVLMRNSPLIRPHVFVGQASGKNSEGMSQKKQLEVVDKFKRGELNTLIATSIGEEGLDIGEVDLIVCYDSKSSPLRMLQRMGRTGRKRAGRIMLFQMEGKEENDAVKAKDSYEAMQAKIADGGDFTFHDDRSKRILPRDMQPTVDKRRVDIPIENSQRNGSDFLPVPTKRPRGPRKKPQKLFYMPDDAQTGFTTASRMDGGGVVSKAAPQKRKSTPRVIRDEVIPSPEIQDIMLSQLQRSELGTLYRDVNFGDEELYNAEPHKELGRHHELQRQLRPQQYVSHGRPSRNFVKLMNRMHGVRMSTVNQYNITFEESLLSPVDTANTLVDDSPVVIQSQEESSVRSPPKPPARRRAQPPKAPRAKAQSAKAKSAKAQPARAQTRPPTKRARIIVSPDAAEEAEASSPPATAPEMALPSQGIALGSADTSGEDEPGDEADSDLESFVAGDDESIVMRSSSVPRATFDRTPLSAKTANTLLFLSQESGGSDALPDLAALVSAKGRRVPGVRLNDNGDAHSRPKAKPGAGAAAKKRRVVLSDDE